MANDKDFIVKDAVEVGGSVKTTVGTLTSGSEGYNLSVASYDNKSFSVASQDTNANGFIFNATGTKLYVVGRTNQSIFQYSLSTSYDISTASYDSVSFSVAAQETNPIEAFFKSDGTKLYVIGWDGDAVFQYGLTTAYDISTASYDSVSFSFASQDTVATSIYFKPDGTKFYIMGAINDAVFQYSLSTEWDMSTASYDSVSFSFSSQETNPYGLLFNSDGTKMFVTGNTSDATFQYSLTTAWDLSTASYDSVSLDHTTVMTDPFGTRFNSDGSKFYVVASNDTIYQYSTALLTQTLDLSTGNYFNHTLTENTQFPLSNAGNVQSFQLEVTGGAIGYNLAGASYDSVSFSVASEETVPYKIRFNNDGTKLYVMGVVGDDINQYTLSTAFDLSTASYDSVSFSVASQETDPYGLAFNNDGTKMYITGNVSDSVFQYTLSPGFDLSTASYDSVSLNVNSQDTIPTGIIFNNTGSKMYMIGQSSDQIHQYTLTADFNLSTASYDNVSFSIASEETSPMDMAFNSDGTKMYIVGSSSDTVFQYSLSTAYDISTASYDNVSFNVNTQDSNPRSLVFNNNGTKMYIIGTTTDSIYQYSTRIDFTITWPTSIEWPDGTAPVSPSDGEKDLYTITTDDSGTTYKGVLSAYNLS